MTDEAADLRLRSISELLQETFFVPSYQRGYRWTPKQVTTLLDDLEVFLRGDPPRDSYYCLQPVVVRRRDDGSWELVDGQQRLTTIHLVLGYLGELARMLGKQPYDLRYQTREGSAKFLQNPTPEVALSNIDYYHMHHAREAIHAWFAARDGTVRLKVFECLTQPSNNGANVRVIWYELAGPNPRAAFIRLNVGRIPLTSAELIRALFLRTDGGAVDPRQHQIAQEWDLIEKRLHDPSYWYFLQSELYEPSTRIEYLFDISCRVHQPKLAEHPDDLATFFAFQAWLDRAPPHDRWLEFRKEIAQTLEEWFEDRVLYHLVGTLIAVAPEGRSTSARLLVELLRDREGKTGTEFERHLRGRLWRSFLGNPNAELPQNPRELESGLDERIDALRYGGDQARLRTVLLLFNVAGLLANPASIERFRFDGFKQNTWDIEHIRSVTELIPTSPGRRKSWLEHARSFVDSPAGRARDPDSVSSLLTKIDRLLAANAPDTPGFEEVFEAVRTLSGEHEADDTDALSNLALLDMGTNRSYKNAIFPVKRERIIELDRKGVYVPPGTRNVFLKYYSPRAAQLLLWDAEDQVAYGVAQRETLLRFFQQIVEGSQ